MTAAFDEFMRQHRMTGSEKADGYSSNVFVGLSVEEKETVFSLLENELPWSADWIFVVDPIRAAAVVKELVQARRGDPYGSIYMAQQNLVRHTGDLLYQKQMIEDYPGYDNNARHLVVAAISHTPTNAATLAFLKKVVLEESDSMARFSAAWNLLSSLKVPRVTELEIARYDGLLSKLRGDDLGLREQALVQLAPYERKRG